MPSWQARLVATFCRHLFKRRVKGEEVTLVKYLRKKLEPLSFLRPRPPKDISIQPVSSGAIRGEWVRPENASSTIIYYLHGGGYVACSPATHRGFTAALAREAGANVFALDYRLAPEHRFPAADSELRPLRLSAA